MDKSGLKADYREKPGGHEADGCGDGGGWGMSGQECALLSNKSTNKSIFKQPRDVTGFIAAY